MKCPLDSSEGYLYGSECATSRSNLQTAAANQQDSACGWPALGQTGYFLDFSVQFSSERRQGKIFKLGWGHIVKEF